MISQVRNVGVVDDDVFEEIKLEGMRGTDSLHTREEVWMELDLVGYHVKNLKFKIKRDNEPALSF